LIKEHTDPKESKLIDGILTESDAEYLAKEGLSRLTRTQTTFLLRKQGRRIFSERR
jgi:hypothetical protein